MKKEKRRNYFMGLSPANMISLGSMALVGLISLVTMYNKVGALETKTNKMEIKQSKEHEVIRDMRIDVAVIKTIVKRLDRRKRRNRGH